MWRCSPPDTPPWTFTSKTHGGDWQRVELAAFTDGVHHGTVKGLEAGSRYAFWPHGQALPASGQLLLDPYGRGIDDDDGFFTGVRHRRFRLGD